MKLFRSIIIDSISIDAADFETEMIQQISGLSNRTVCSIGRLKILASSQYIANRHGANLCIANRGTANRYTGHRFVGIPASRLEINATKASFRLLHTRPDDESPANLSVRPTGDCTRLIEQHRTLSLRNYRPHSLKDFYDFLDRTEDARTSFAHTLNSSASMRLVLLRAGQLINSASDKRFLLALLGILSRTKENPRSWLVGKTIEELSRKLEDLDSTELLDCLIMMNSYLNRPFAEDDLFQFNLKLLRVAKRRILGNALDPTDIDLTINYLIIFLKNEDRANFSVSEFLIDRLLSASSRPSLTF